MSDWSDGSDGTDPPMTDYGDYGSPTGRGAPGTSEVVVPPSGSGGGDSSSGGNFRLPSWLTDGFKKYLFTGKNNDELNWNNLLPLLVGGGGGILSLLANRQAKKDIPKMGFQGSIPQYSMQRTAMPVDLTRRPGIGGVRYFTDPTYTVRAADGGLMGLKKGQYLDGPTDGMADKLPTTIGGAQPAALSHGEFVIPADVVSHLGNGNSNAGAERLYEMMDRIREARTGTSKQGKQINPNKFLPK